MLRKQPGFTIVAALTPPWHWRRCLQPDSRRPPDASSYRQPGSWSPFHPPAATVNNLQEGGGRHAGGWLAKLATSFVRSPVKWTFNFLV
jgi:hypothetical protein